MYRPIPNFACCATALALAGSVGPSEAQSTQVYRLDRQAQWEEWNIAPGTIQFNEDGALTPTLFETNFNAALDATEFIHGLAGDKETTGGIWRVGSTANQAGIAPENVIDGDPNTIWKPDPDADLSEWWIELDLGRAVSVYKIRLVFPDTVGARPLREFRIMGADGRRRTFNADLFTYEVLGGTTRHNDQTIFDLDLKSVLDTENTVLFAEPGEATDFIESYRNIQYIRIRIDSQSEDAALAELEAFTFGTNFALGSLARGGEIIDITGRGVSLIDADFNTTWAVHGTPEEPTVWILDLGAFAWVDRLMQLTAPNKRIRDHRLMSSDGSLKLTGLSSTARTKTTAADLDYEEIYLDDDKSEKADVQYLMAKPQAMRYVAAIYPRGNGDMSEIVVIPTGHLAQVEIESNFIDLGDFAGDQRAKQIQRITWDAIQPEGTDLEVRTRTGHGLTDLVKYYTLAGELMEGKAAYENLNKFLRGDTDTSIVAGDDWSAWSVPYSDQDRFLSPSPRRFLQIKLILSSDAPELAATVRSLDVEFIDAVIRGVAAEIEPREVEASVPTTFTYKMWGDFSDPASFDRLLFVTPSRVDTDSLVIRVGGIERGDFSVEKLTTDSLIVQLVEPVAQDQDTVEVRMRVQIKQNPTIFNAFVGQVERPELWQPVTATDRIPRATQVFLPAVPSKLLSDVSVHPRIVTPNGDSVGDQGEIRFSVFNVDVAPEVTVYSLAGRIVAVLQGALGADGRHVYTWTGRDQSGEVAPPGLYLYRIHLDTQKNEQEIVRTVGLAY